MNHDSQPASNVTTASFDIKSEIKASNRKKRRAVYRAKKRREAATQDPGVYDPLAEWTDNHLNNHSYFYRKSKYTTMQEAIKWLKPEPNARPPRPSQNVNQQGSRRTGAAYGQRKAKVAALPSQPRQ